MRINKYLSAKGVCSRREADRLLEAGRITVDGAVAECGQQVDDNNIICIDGSKISNDKPEDILSLLALYVQQLTSREITILLII